MQISSLAQRLCALSLAALLTAPASATPLNPGGNLSFGDYLSYEIATGDPDWFGTELTTVRASASEVRDGILPGIRDVIPDLYAVSAGLETTVSRAANGRLIFKVLPFASDGSFAGAGFNGAKDFSFSGFAGFNVDFGWILGAAPSSVAPIISRSADGDTISIDMLDPNIPILGGFEDLLFSVDAPGFTLSGMGSVGIIIDTFGTLPNTLTGLPAPSVVPLPASGLVLMLGLGALHLTRRRKSRT